MGKHNNFMLYAIIISSIVCRIYECQVMITSFDSLIITFHAEKIADWVYNIYHTLSILRTGNNELFIFMLYTHIHIYSYMCEIQLTVAGASIIVQKISPSFQVFLLRKTRDYVLCMAKQCNFQKGVW